MILCVKDVLTDNSIHMGERGVMNYSESTPLYDTTVRGLRLDCLQVPLGMYVVTRDYAHVHTYIHHVTPTLCALFFIRQLYCTPWYLVPRILHTYLMT